jgi:hypothetical protein
MRSIFKDKDRKIEFKPVMAGLRKIKPTKWSTEAFFSVNVIEEKAKAIRADETNKELIQKIENIFRWN